MNILPQLILFIYGGIGIIILILLIYFIIRRIDEKKKEDFEKRDN